MLLVIFQTTMFLCEIDSESAVTFKGIWNLKVLATIPYFKFYFFPHLVTFLQFRDPSYLLNVSTKAVLQKWHI